MLSVNDRKVCAAFGLDPRAYERHRTTQTRQAEGASQHAQIYRNIGVQAERSPVDDDLI